jgi:hypothetical protein
MVLSSLVFLAMATPSRMAPEKAEMLLVRIVFSSAGSQQGFEQPGKDGDDKRDQDKRQV